MIQKEFNEEDLINGIRAREDKMFNYIHVQCFNVVRMIVIKNSGTEEDAEDVYNEGIIGLLEAINKPNLEMNCKISTLFISICKHQWLLVLSKRKTERKYNFLHDETYFEEKIEELIDKEIYQDLLWLNFEKLKKDCKTILRGYLKEMSVKEIAELMGLSPAYLKKKKHFCHKHLIQLISEHPDYVKIQESDKILTV